MTFAFATFAPNAEIKLTNNKGEAIMDAKVSKLINEQINKELYSAYLYLDFANYYASVGLDGFENWYRIQAQEERDHALLFYQYLQNNGEVVTFEPIAKPEWERGGNEAPLKKGLEHEKYVTELKIKYSPFFFVPKK